MKKPFVHIIAGLALLLLQACCGCVDETKHAGADVSITEEKPAITFAVAGHIYGNPDTYTNSIYPPFLAQLKKDHAARRFDFLFLTGDVVAHATDSNWNTVLAELNSLNLKWLIAPGNHDLGNGFVPVSQPFSESCGLGGPYWFVRSGRSEMLVLNTSNPGWTVDEDQRKALTNHLQQLKSDSTDNIFVFTHQLWWERNPPAEFGLDSLRPNSFACYDGTSDFWCDVFPCIDSTGIETWFFAGDMGSHYTLPAYYEDHYNRFHFYGSGMGGGISDNYLIVEVYQNGRVDIEKVNF